MILRHQRVLFYCLLVGIIGMAFALVYERQRVRERMTARGEETPLAAPVTLETEPVTLDLASDSDGSITAVERQIALPAEASVKARGLLERLFLEYALPLSTHRLPSGPAVDNIFLLRPPGVTRSDEVGELAVVDLRGSFLAAHPSGQETESLSLLSMLGTLHANLPQITQVRFLVDGKSQETFAGHFDLERSYPAVDTTVSAMQLQPPGYTSSLR